MEICRETLEKLEKLEKLGTFHEFLTACKKRSVDMIISPM